MENLTSGSFKYYVTQKGGGGQLRYEGRVEVDRKFKKSKRYVILGLGLDFQKK